MTNEELYHHGILGMKWGRRRSKRELGYKEVSSTKRPNSRLEVMKAKRTQKQEARDAERTAKQEKEKEKNKTISDISDDELRNKINRLQMERQYLDLNRQISAMQPQHVSKGKALVESVLKNVIVPTATEAGKKYLNKMLEDKLGLKAPEDSTSKLKKEVELLNLKRQKAISEDFLANRKAKQNSKKANPDDSKTSEKTESKDEKQSWNTNKQSSGNKQETNSNDKKTEPKQEKKVYDGTVEGEGTSTYKPKQGPIVEGEWRNADVSDLPKERIQIGQTFIAGLLEDKSGR